MSAHTECVLRVCGGTCWKYPKGWLTRRLRRLSGAGTSVFDGDFPPEAHDHSIPYSVYVESKPYGAEQVRQGYLSAGDVLAVIVQSRKGTAKAVPFRQTVALQSQLLG